jgi:hypothetical protein
MRLIAALAAGFALSGCAIFQPFVSDSRGAAAPAREELTPVAASAPRTADARGPVGLSPCAGKVFPGRGCWRKGDEHVIYPAAYDASDYSASTMYEAASASRKAK